jgi:hypothetical protein
MADRERHPLPSGIDTSIPHFERFRLPERVPELSEVESAISDDFSEPSG